MTKVSVVLVGAPLVLLNSDLNSRPDLRSVSIRRAFIALLLSTKLLVDKVRHTPRQHLTPTMSNFIPSPTVPAVDRSFEFEHRTTGTRQ